MSPLSIIYIVISFIAGATIGCWFWLGPNRLRDSWLGNKVFGVIFFLLGVSLAIISGLASKEAAHPGIYALGLFFELLSAGWLVQFWKKQPKK